MPDSVENLILDLIDLVARKPRTYHETMDDWRTSCPRLPVWEDATSRGLAETIFANGVSTVKPAQAGLAFPQEKRPDSYEQLSGILPI